MYEKIEQNIWWVVIYLEDYSQIADKFGELNDAELVLTAADGQEHALGTASYLHEFTAWHRDKGNYGKGKFSPYYWPGYNDFIHWK